MKKIILGIGVFFLFLNPLMGCSVITDPGNPGYYYYPRSYFYPFNDYFPYYDYYYPDYYGYYNYNGNDHYY